jgi:hypothetical protein
MDKCKHVWRTETVEEVDYINDEVHDTNITFCIKCNSREEYGVVYQPIVIQKHPYPPIMIK